MNLFLEADKGHITFCHKHEYLHRKKEGNLNICLHNTEAFFKFQKTPELKIR